ncbi:MAG: hypothetical protein AAFQ88_06765 [Pseudomonadota bacterium]
MMMTADDGRSAFDHAMATLRKLRGYWIVTTFALGALFWFYDAWQAHAPLPQVVAAHTARLETLEAAVPRRPFPPAAQADDLTAETARPLLILPVGPLCPAAGRRPGGPQWYHRP